MFALGGDYVVKAQILAGGRGKGSFTNGFRGGVHKAYSPEEVKDLASKMLGKVLVTKQTGPRGKPVNVVLVQERIYARRELYLAMMLDRKTAGPVLIGSSAGGMNIEEVAAETPELIHRYYFSIEKGPVRSEVEDFVKKLGFGGPNVQRAADEIEKLYKVFRANDATLVEINPLIETPKDGVVCADAKVNIDDSSHFKHEELFNQRDWSQDDVRDVKAAKYDLTYIGLDGNIGCIVNGAGLASFVSLFFLQFFL